MTFFSMALGHFNIMFPKITMFNSKKIRGGSKSSSKMKNTGNFKILAKKNPTFEHFDFQKTHYKFFFDPKLVHFLFWKYVWLKISRFKPQDKWG